MYEKAKEECLDKMEDYRIKDYRRYKNDSLSCMIRLAAYIPKGEMARIVRMYKKNPSGIALKANLFIFNIIASVLLQPLAYFWIIKWSLGGSLLKTFKVLPNFLKEGVMRYLIPFKKSNACSKKMPL